VYILTMLMLMNTGALVVQADLTWSTAEQDMVNFVKTIANYAPYH